MVLLAFVEPTPEEKEQYETVCCDDGGTCEEFWNGTEPYETDDDEETCGGPPGKPCKECARKYCEDARGRTARLVSNILRQVLSLLWSLCVLCVYISMIMPFTDSIVNNI